MDLHEYSFWMGGRYARSVIEVSDDLSRLDDGNFWAVAITFEGQVTIARFASNFAADFPFSGSDWKPLEGEWLSSIAESDFCKYVQSIRKEIADGWVYQVNACRQLSIDSNDQSLASFFGKLLKENPAPYASYLSLPQLQIASASPELFLSRSGAKIKSSPIKGTQKLDQDGFGAKDQSENVMIVDLMRNDFGQICRPGTIEVEELLRTEEHPGLRHLVSDVVGELNVGIKWAEIFQALLPAGSISGAPKSSALSVIAENEKTKRGPYCGVLGWVEGDRAELSVAIRIFWRDGDGLLKFGTGAGITFGSDPLAEWLETELKAQRLISIAGGIKR